nr:ABC transporter G family member 14-like isoform X3 [Physcomitrium patens]|eukprot:XP_024379444.1 ABC transporter G family member 14-like isoform X3 [Physcomitrella patens]
MGHAKVPDKDFLETPDHQLSSVPITLKFSNVVYSVTMKQPKNWWNITKLKRNVMKTQDKTKEILHGVSGVVRAGEMLVMLGPSGSGKTTLLNVLGGRLKSAKVKGTILYNDETHSNFVKRRTGFVTQDDVLFPNLTVKETLVYAARLRLPDTYTREAKVQRAESIITELGLERCKDTIIGGPFKRGVSGGERKRVSIGHEMLVDPSLLFLDEPTSGLDSTTALRIIKTLQDMAKSGKTIITTIHQPSSTVYHMFDKMILLSEGHLLYYGDGHQAMSYFASIHFSPPFPMNPADFLLDLANGVTPDRLIEGEDKSGAFEGKKHNEDPQAVRQVLIKAYKSNLEHKIDTEVASTSAPATAFADKAGLNKWSTSWREQFSVLLERGWKERRHEAFSPLKIGQVLAISIICGLLWYDSPESQVQDRVGLLFFFITFWGFFPVFSAIFTFPQERAMLIKERASGMYRLSAYFMARVIGDMPLELVLPTIFITIVYWMAGLKQTFLAFILTLLVILYTVLVSQGLGLTLGAALMDVKKATTLASVIMLTLLLAGGYYIQNTPKWIAWIKYLSVSYWSYKLQLAAQYSPDQTYACSTGSSGRCRIADYPAVANVGLDQLGIAAMAMAIMLVGYRLSAYFFLSRIKGHDK